MDITEVKPVVYTAHSKLNFFCRDAICEYVLRLGSVPVNPFRLFDYFLNDRVDRDLVRRGNNNLVRMADEVWVFGPVSNGVLFEIGYAADLGKTVRYHTVSPTSSEIAPTAATEITFEEELLARAEDGERELREVIARSLRRRRVGETPVLAGK